MIFGVFYLEFFHKIRKIILCPHIKILGLLNSTNLKSQIYPIIILEVILKNIYIRLKLEVFILICILTIERKT